MRKKKNKVEDYYYCLLLLYQILNTTRNVKKKYTSPKKIFLTPRINYPLCPETFPTLILLPHTPITRIYIDKENMLNKNYISYYMEVLTESMSKV